MTLNADLDMRRLGGVELSSESVRVKYRLEEHPPLAVTILSSLQWVGFVIACNAMVPLVIGDAFGFSSDAVAGLTQRMFLIIGVVSLLQVIWGHRWPISEGVSYVWMGVFVALAGVTKATGGDPQAILPKLEGGLILTGLALTTASLLGLTTMFQRWFTPTVVATYLILLPIQFSGPFLRSMLGVGTSGAVGPADFAVAGVCAVAIVVTLGFSLWGRGSLRSLSSLLGLVSGVTVWLLAGLPLTRAAGAASTTVAGGAIPFVLAWGPPQWDAGIIVSSLVTGFLLLSNLFGSLSATEQSAGIEASVSTFRRTTAFNGLGSIVAGVLSGVGLVPVATSAGVVRLTGVASRRPFVISCLILICIAFWGSAARLISLLPLPLAYAVTFAAFNEMLALGVLRLRGTALTRGNLSTLSLSVFVGTGLMFIPPAALLGLHPILRNVLGNGLLTGALLSLLLEHLVFRGLSENV